MTPDPLPQPAANAVTPADPVPDPIDGTARWLDDLSEGMTFRTGSYEVTEQEVIGFASRYDPQRFHLDDAGASGTFFDGLAASTPPPGSSPGADHGRPPDRPVAASEPGCRP